MIAAGVYSKEVDTSWSPCCELTQEEIDVMVLCLKACEDAGIVHEIGIVPWRHFVPCDGDLNWTAETRNRGPPGFHGHEKRETHENDFKPQRTRRAQRCGLRLKT